MNWRSLVPPQPAQMYGAVHHSLTWSWLFPVLLAELTCRDCVPMEELPKLPYQKLPMSDLVLNDGFMSQPYLVHLLS